MREAVSRIPDSHIAEIRARTPLAPLISRRVKLARSGKQWVGCCPFHNERSPSFYVYPDNHFHCFGCGGRGDAIDFVQRTQGLSWQDAVKALAAESGLDVMREPTTPVAVQRDTARDAADRADRERRTERAIQIYREAGPGGEMVRTYLESRGCGASIPEILRFHPRCPRGAAGGVDLLPAMVAPISDPITNEQVGTHCTYLRPDGAGKIENGKTKTMWGGWGVIRLVPDETVTLGLGICEGIETGLTIMQCAGWGAVWAAGCAGSIAKFSVLGGVECLTIFPDLDDAGAGRDAAAACGDRWEAAGREVDIIYPPGGLDWNDALSRKAA